jgi:hypothetical protein
VGRYGGCGRQELQRYDSRALSVLTLHFAVAIVVLEQTVSESIVIETAFECKPTRSFPPPRLGPFNSKRNEV